MANAFLGQGSNYVGISVSDASDIKYNNEISGLESTNIQDAIDEIMDRDTVTSVNEKTGNVTLNKVDIGLENVDNTSDLNKPISTATSQALLEKSDVGHTHTKSDISDFPTTFPPEAHNHDDLYYRIADVDSALDEKADVTHTHTKSQITDFPTSFPPATHTHTKSEISDFPTTFPPESHTHDDRYYTENEMDTKLSEKANTSHTHTKSQITDFPSSMPASDVYSWAKASSKPTYTASEVGALPLTGGKLTGTLSITVPTGSWSEGIRLHPSSNGWTTLAFCGTDNTGDTGTSANTWSMHGNNGNFYLSKNGSNSASTQLACVNNAWSANGQAIVLNNDSRLSNSRPASDVYSWAKASTKPSYAWSEITSKPSAFTPSSHTHTKSQITDFPTSLPANGGKASNVTAYHYSTTSTSTGIFKININSATSWMLAFTIRLYQGYQYEDIVVSGYNYGANHWYTPQAILLGSTSGVTSVNVYFGYDSNWNLWVAIPGTSYTGLDIRDVTNGYTQINIDYSNLFTVSVVSSTPTTLQTTVTAYRPMYRNDITQSTVDLTPGSSNLATGAIYMVYE